MSGKTDCQKPIPQMRWSNSVSGYLRYIGTRERVELLPGNRPPTRKQEQLITKLVKDFPNSQELDEYSDYATKHTKANASTFITRALEENWAAVQQSGGLHEVHRHPTKGGAAGGSRSLW